MADPMEWFVNRLKQLQGFQKMMRGETDKCIMAIRAPAEMGKSWLIQRMRQECGAANLPTLYIDFRDRRPYDCLTIVRTARDQMGATAFNALTQTINEMTGVNIQLSTSGPAVTGGAQINVVGQQASVSGTQVSVGNVDVAGGNIIKDNHFYVQADSGTARRAIEIRITDAFFACLTASATPEKKVCFLLDSYENVTEEADRWLRDNLLARLRDKQLANVIAIIAGRTTPDFGDEWKARLASTGLDPFTQDDVTDYLTNKRKVTGLDVATVFKTCGGRSGPAQPDGGTGDDGDGKSGGLAMSDPIPSASLDQQSATLTATLFSKLPPVLARALQLAAIPYWFDLPLLTAVRGPDDADGRTPKILDWLRERSFVSRLPRDRYVLNTDVRDLIRARWTQDRQGFAEANSRLAEYFAGRMATASGPEADELRQAYIYHLLGAAGSAGIVELQQAFAEAEFSHRLAVAERLVEVAAEQRSFLEPRHVAWIEYLHARSLQLHNRWGASSAQLQALLEQTDLPSELRPRVQAALAASLVEIQHWTQAIELYQQARVAFETLGLYDEVAACQLGLGYAHMDLGLNVWGQRESRPTPSPSIWQTLVDLATLPVRLPILLYVLFSAREVELFPAGQYERLGRDLVRGCRKQHTGTEGHEGGDGSVPKVGGQPENRPHKRAGCRNHTP